MFVGHEFAAFALAAAIATSAEWFTGVGYHSRPGGHRLGYPSIRLALDRVSLDVG